MADAEPAARMPPSANIAPGDEVLLAMLPTVLALSVCFGWGTLLNALWAVPAATAATLLAARVAGTRPTPRAGWIAALVLAIALPPASGWWLVAGTAALATGVLRPLMARGALPPLNAAMAAYALALLLLPLHTGHWPAPTGAPPLPPAPVGFVDTLRAALGTAPALDGFTMATPLELLRHDTTHTLAELRARHPQFGAWGGTGWEWVNAAALAGGLWLLARRRAPWQASAGMLAMLCLAAVFGHDGGSSASGGSPLLHLFSGGTLFAALFVLTEPLGGARTPRGRLAFGAVVGLLVYLLRQHGAFADGIAFAVVFANGIAPLLDTLPGARLPPGETAHGGGWRTRIAGGGIGLLALLCGWNGVDADAASGTQARADIAREQVLGTVPRDATTDLETFPVSDPLLLGYASPRTAWRARYRGEVSAVVLPVRAGDGYAGPIELLAGIDREGRLTGVRVLAHRETPGIGDVIEARRSDWILGFARDAAHPAPPDALSGATVSTQSVRGAVARALRYFEIHRATLLGDAPPRDTHAPEAPR